MSFNGDVAAITVEGIVVSADNGNPVTGALVTVSAGTGPARPSVADSLAEMLASGAPPRLGARGGGGSAPTVTTQADGKFSFGLDPGTYRISVTATGYVPGEFGKKTATGTRTPIFIEAGETHAPVTVRLVATGVVLGRVADSALMDAQQVPIRALRVGYNRFGQRLLETGALGITDDRGQFRLFGVPPGRYYLSIGTIVASGAGLIGSTIPRPGALRHVYAHSYYPGVLDLNRAVVIEVKPGEEVRADMLATRSARYRVSGRVVDSRSGTAPTSATIWLTYHAPDGGTSGRSTRLNSASGTFEFQDVDPAAYTLEAELQDNSPNTPDNPAAKIAREFERSRTSIAIDVTDNLQNLLVTIVRAAPLEGRLTVNGQPPAQLPNLDRIRPGLRQFANGGVLPFGPLAQVSANGAFRFDAIRDGEYMFGITGLPSGFYVEKAELNGTDLLSQPIRFSNAVSGSLNVVVQRGTGLISGRVVDHQSRMVAGVQVVLVPDQRRRLDLYNTTITDKDGRFTITEVPPGSYSVFSCDGLEPYSYFDPDTLSRYEVRARRVRIPESTGSIDVTLIPVEP